MNNDRKGRDIFYGVVAVATLIVAIVGATLAYFSISDSSAENAVSATAATVSIEYNDGQQVTAQADKLIPATLDVVKSVYSSNKANFGTDGAMASNICVDANDRQVCSIYRFTVGSDVTRNVVATLNNEYNGFTYLSYAVYDVTANAWLSLDETNSQSMAISACDNASEDATKHCSTGTAPDKTYSVNAINSIFGYTLKDSLRVNATKPVTATANVYDLVIFLRETQSNQNIDQGKSYQGTIIVSVADGSEAEHITGTTEN